MRRCLSATAGMFSLSLGSHYPKDTVGLQRVCEERVRLTTPYQERGNMRKLHKEHVLNPAEHTCQCENMCFSATHTCGLHPLYGLSCRHTAGGGLETCVTLIAVSGWLRKKC